jgi:hypothetical protein
MSLIFSDFCGSIEFFRLPRWFSINLSPDTVRMWHGLYFRLIGSPRSLHLNDYIVVSGNDMGRIYEISET